MPRRATLNPSQLDLAARAPYHDFMKAKEKTQYWLELENYDIDTASAMLETRRFLYVGFMCHQAGEKSLKAHHCATRDDDPPYIHSLRRLAEASGLLANLTPEQLRLLFELEPMNISARYPADKARILEDLNADRCRSLIDQTKELLNWIERKH